MKLLLYCTKKLPRLVFRQYELSDGRWYEGFQCGTKDYVGINELGDCETLNGKIVAECDYEISEIEFKFAFSLNVPLYITKRKEPFKYFSYIDLLKASCLQDNEMFKYLGEKDGKAIHIKNLHIFDWPKELGEYCKDKYTIITWHYVKKAPKNMMYVFDGNEKKVLISIHPEQLCKILNGEKTIEVRKKVLKDTYKK